MKRRLSILLALLMMFSATAILPAPHQPSPKAITATTSVITGIFKITVITSARGPGWVSTITCGGVSDNPRSVPQHYCSHLLQQVSTSACQLSSQAARVGRAFYSRSEAQHSLPRSLAASVGDR